jgi:hypothetical protein
MADENKTAEDENNTPVDAPEATPPAEPAPAADPAPAEPEAQTGEEPPAEAPEFDPAAWSDERDEVADSVFQLLHEGGATPDEAKSLLYDAVQAGKVEDIDKDALVEKVGKARANLIMAGVKNFITERNQRTEAAVQAVHKTAGGQAAWEKVAKWVGENQPEGLDEYRAMIDAGGRQAELAVAALVKMHNADPKTKSIGKTEIMGDGPSNKQQEGISQRAYGDRLAKLHRQNKATDEARSELLRLRRLGRQQGL